jgi:hypothetical protein
VGVFVLRWDALYDYNWKSRLSSAKKCLIVKIIWDVSRHRVVDDTLHASLDGDEELDWPA